MENLIGIASLGTLAAAVAFVLIAVFLPIWVYFIYLNTGKMTQELKQIRQLLGQTAAHTLPTKPKDTRQVTCPHCLTQTKYPEALYGQSRPCPGCKIEIILQG